MAEQDNDIKLFRQLREQLAPALSEATQALLLRIETKLGLVPSEAIPLFPKNKTKIKKPTHKERVRMFL